MPVYSSHEALAASTVGGLVERVYRDFLHPADDQPVVLALAEDIGDEATSLTYDTAGLAPDEESLLGPGVLLEAGYEQMRVLSVDATSGEVTVARAANGTSATIHLEGEPLTVAPTFTRQAVLDAVSDNIQALSPSLWRTATVNITTSRDLVELPADVVDIVELYVDGRAVSAQFIDNAPTSTGKAVATPGLRSGRTGYLTYRAAFERPASEFEELADLGVRPEWRRIVVVGAAAQVVAGRDLDALTAEYITEQLQREALPAGGPQSIRNGLLTLHNLWLDEARQALRVERPARIVMQR